MGPNILICDMTGEVTKQDGKVSGLGNRSNVLFKQFPRNEVAAYIDCVFLFSVSWML